MPIGKAEVLCEGKDVCFWAIGTMVDTALKVRNKLQEHGIQAGVVNMRFAKPLDSELLIKHANSYPKLITLEEGVIAGGVGEEVLDFLNAEGLLKKTQVLNLGLPDAYIPHGDKKLLLRDIELDVDAIVEKSVAFIKD